MKAFQLHLNGKKLCVAGVGENGVLSAIVDCVTVRGRDMLQISVGGFISSKAEHVGWLEQRKLQTGDQIRIKIVEVESADSPRTRRRRSDPVVELRERKRYLREMAKKFGWTITTGRSRRAKGRP
jgi:hypothetical protein